MCCVGVCVVRVGVCVRCVCVVCVCVCLWCVVCLVCGVARRKNLRVEIQNVPVCTGTTRTCVTTCGRGVGTHRDVLNLHTEVFWKDTRGGRREKEGEERERRGRSPSVLLT